MLKETKEKLDCKLPKETKRITLIALILLSMDIVASLLTPYVQMIEFFFGKSELRMLSDLLFLEGAVIFTIGASWVFVSKDLRSRLSVILLLITISASFLGLSVIIGELFLRH